MHKIIPLLIFLSLSACGGGGSDAVETAVTISGTIVGSAETLNGSDTITVTVHKEWIQDVNGNPMAADYTYTFTVGS